MGTLWVAQFAVVGSDREDYWNQEAHDDDDPLGNMLSGAASWVRSAVRIDAVMVGLYYSLFRANKYNRMAGMRRLRVTLTGQLRRALKRTVRLLIRHSRIRLYGKVHDGVGKYAHIQLHV